MGRHKQFDEAEVLEKAMLTFWENGFEKTTVRSLEKSMGINQFSIYSTFQSKEILYRRVLKTYHEQLNHRFLDKLNKPSCSLEDVEHFLNTFSLQLKQKKIPNSCLMVQSTANLDRFDAGIRKVILDFFDTMKKQFARAVENDVKNGLLPKDTDIKQTGEYLLGLAQSISIYGKIRSQKEVKNYISFSLSKLKHDA